jgi:hypothetical protein
MPMCPCAGVRFTESGRFWHGGSEPVLCSGRPLVLSFFEFFWVFALCLLRWWFLSDRTLERQSRRGRWNWSGASPSVLSLGAWREPEMGEAGEFAGGGKFLVPGKLLLFTVCGGGRRGVHQEVACIEGGEAHYRRPASAATATAGQPRYLLLPGLLPTRSLCRALLPSPWWISVPTSSCRWPRNPHDYCYLHAPPSRFVYRPSPEP